MGEAAGVLDALRGDELRHLRQRDVARDAGGHMPEGQEGSPGGRTLISQK